MSERRPLSKAEQEIASMVGELGRATVRDVLEALPADREIEYKTVQTYLRRLEEKGYVAADRSGRSTVFSLLVRPTQVVREVVSDVVDRLFHGDALPLVEHLIEDRRFSADEVRRLRELLDEADEEDEGRP